MLLGVPPQGTPRAVHPRVVLESLVGYRSQIRFEQVFKLGWTETHHLQLILVLADTKFISQAEGK